MLFRIVRSARFAAVVGRWFVTAAGAVAACATAFAAPAILSFDEVQRGMRGHGRSVFQGTQVESFDVEILGKLPNVGPGQDLILARCSGGPLAETGILAGMSGSPVFVDDRLIGAIAYGWGFSKTAIAGITPIEEMLAVADIPPTPARVATGFSTWDEQPLEMLATPALRAGFFERQLGRLLAASGGLRDRALPLAIAGFDPEVIAGLTSSFARAGFLPVQVGSLGSASDPGTPALEPGSAIGLQLTRGAVEITAVGTATWVDDQRILGFGHPLFGLGSLELPIAAARVETLLPSLAQSAKIATPLGEVGALTQDRAAGVAGRRGRAPRMIPVRLAWTGGDGARREFSYEIADDPLLSPILLYVSLSGIVASRERAIGSATVRLAEGSVIRREGGDDVEVDNLFAGPTASEYGTGLAAYVLHLLMNNAWSSPRILGVNLILEYDPTPRLAQVRRVSVDRARVRPGETVTANIVLEPFRGAPRTLTRELRIPATTPPGDLTLEVGGAGAASRAGEGQDPLSPESLEQLVRLINELRRNDRVHVLATVEDAGAIVGGVRLPGLPPSIARVLSRPRSSGNFAFVDRRAVLEESIPTEYAVEGIARLVLEVEEP